MACTSVPPPPWFTIPATAGGIIRVSVVTVMATVATGATDTIAHPSIGKTVRIRISPTIRDTIRKGMSMGVQGGISVRMTTIDEGIIMKGRGMIGAANGTGRSGYV